MPSATLAMMERTTLERLAEKAGRLYSLPAVAARVLELTSSPNADARALKECIENDPALAVKVLRVVNSSLYGLAHEVSDLNQAIALLGVKPLKLLVLGFSLPPKLFAGCAGNILPWYWRHTLVKAVAAREIAEAFWRQPGDEAFLVGLLQDVGMLALIQELGEPYVRFLAKVFVPAETTDERHEAAGAFGSTREVLALETEAIGFDHTQLSTLLLSRWGLPDVLAEAVGSPRAGGTVPSTAIGALRRVLTLASLTAELLADGRPGVLADLAAQAEAEGIPAADLEQLLAGLEEKVRQLADALSLEVPTDFDCQGLLLEAHHRLADLAAEVASELARGGLARRVEPPCEQDLLDELRSLTNAVACSTQRLGDPAREETEPRKSEPASLDARPSSGPHQGQATDRSSHSAKTATAKAADPGLLGRLAAAVSLCRQIRRPLSLMLVEPDQSADMVLTHGIEGFQRWRRMLEAVCRGLDHPGVASVGYRDAGFAVVLPDCERQPAVQLGNQLLDRVRALTASTTSAGAVGAGVGVATIPLPPKNFPPEELLAAAERCLYGSHASGGAVKSIEIY